MTNLVNTNKAMLLVLMLGFIVITSCENEEEIAPLASDEIGQAASTCSGTVTLNGTVDLSGAQLGDYCAPGRLTFRPPSATCGQRRPRLRFEGQFNSFIRPANSNWFVGTIPLSEVDSSWSAMTITTKASDVGTEPNEVCNGFTAVPQNVLGVDGEFPAGSGDDFGLGYYSYVLGTPTVDRAVVVWRGGSATNPAGATDGFVFAVTALNAVPQNFPPTVFRSQVIFNYRRAL